MLTKEQYILLSSDSFIRNLLDHVIPEEIYMDIYFYDDYGECPNYLKNMDFPKHIIDMANLFGYKKIGNKFINSFLGSHKEYG